MVQLRGPSQFALDTYAKFFRAKGHCYGPEPTAPYQLDYLYEPVDGVFVVVAKDGEVALVEVTAEPAAAAHRREGGHGAGVVHGASEPLDGHGHGATPLGSL